MLAWALLALSGCQLMNTFKETTGVDAACKSNLEFFETEISRPILLKTCVRCHSSDGQASGTRLVLVNDPSAAGVAQNYEILQGVAKLQESGTSLLLLKPQERVPHTGGRVVSPSSAEDRALSEMLRRFEACPTVTSEGTLIPARVRLMNNTEYNNTVAALLGDRTQPARGFPASTPQLGFSNSASQAVSTLSVSALDDAAKKLAETAVFSQLSTLLPCDPAKVGESTCAKEFIATFGARAFRRPLTEEDKTGLYEIYQVSRDTDADFAGAIKNVLYGMLTSGAFLYVTELGEDGTVSGEPLKLTSYELASALSYLILASPPDDKLMAKARDGKLQTKQELAAEARRLLDDPRASAQIRRFFLEWFHIGPSAKDPMIYPSYQALSASFLRETDALIEDVMVKGDGTLRSLLLAEHTFVDGPLASFYELPVPSTPEGELTRVSLDTGKRVGILSHASFLAVHGNQTMSSPVKRGVFIRGRLLCQHLPSPPLGVNNSAPPITPGKTTRDLFAAHASTPGCANCHRLIDPIGNGFEHFDGQGGYRTLDNGKAVDASGELTQTLDADGKFDGLPELAQKLAASEEVQSCLARNMFRFGSAQNGELTERLFFNEMPDPLPESIRDLLVAYVQTKLFSERLSP